MAEKDFDIDGLAQYLHLRPPQVARLADRGQLPGRKIGGQWRFSHAEIHHWLEDRIGLSDEDELLQMEDVLKLTHGEAVEEAQAIADLLPLEAIAIPLEARTRGAVMAGMVRLAAESGLLWDPEKLEEAVKARESLHPTALDNGVALLHPRRPLPNILSQAVVALGRTYTGIPFGGARGVLTDIFFLICSTSERQHLRVLTRISRLISDPALLAGIRNAQEPREVHQLIQEHEQKLSG